MLVLKHGQVITLIIGAERKFLTLVIIPKAMMQEPEIIQFKLMELKVTTNDLALPI